MILNFAIEPWCHVDSQQFSAFRLNQEPHPGQGTVAGRAEGIGRQNLDDLAFARGRGQTADRLKRDKISRLIGLSGFPGRRVIRRMPARRIGQYQVFCV